MNRLVDMVEGLVADSADLQARMDGIAADHDATRDPTHTSHTAEDLIASTLSQSSSTFEADLDSSYVYRKLRPRASIWSLSTSQQGSMALTVFSNLTMDCISNLSVIRLPIWSSNLFNASEYVEDLRTVSSKSIGLRYDGIAWHPISVRRH
jgi:hypothetical protein